MSGIDPVSREKTELMKELSSLYTVRTATPNAVLRRMRLLEKKYAWRAVVGGTYALKRALDIAVSMGMLVALTPLFAVIALLIKFTDGGPILFWQPRVGRWGREFQFPKFRSMVVNAEALKDQLAEHSQHSDSKTFKMKADPRITRIGGILRRFSLDELPQFWCVLKGEMSLVGPRPPVPREVALYTLADRRRLNVTPGLTCIWQVSGRSEIAFPQQVELDVEYIRSYGMAKDLKLLLLTVPAVFFGRGAY